MRRTVLAIGVLLVFGACTHVDTHARAPWGTTPVPIEAANLNWTALDPVGAPGVQIAPVWGDPSKSAFGAFLKLPAGFAAPLHTHSHPMKVVIVSGTYIQQPEGSPEFRLGPGSYLMQPGGSYRHVTRCANDAECVFYFESEGAFDLHVAH
jgi:anti-sigma factor ChrR (cupin superfamily)